MVSLPNFKLLSAALTSRLSLYSYPAATQQKMKYVKPLTLYMEALRRKYSSSSQLLCLYVGEKSVNLAVSNAYFTSADEFPYNIPPFSLKKNDLDLIVAKTIQSVKNNIDVFGLVVPYPFIRNNGKDALQMRNLIYNLRRSGKFKGLKYTYWDESLSSKCCEDYIRDEVLCYFMNLPLSPTEVQQYESCVEHAKAAIVLQGFMESGRMFSGAKFIQDVCPY